MFKFCQSEFLKDLKHRMLDYHPTLLFLIALCHIPLFCIDVSILWFRFSHLFLTLSQKYMVANGKAFNWTNKLVTINLQAIKSSGALENVFRHFVFTMKDNFWKNCAKLSNQFVKMEFLLMCLAAKSTISLIFIKKLSLSWRTLF